MLRDVAAASDAVVHLAFPVDLAYAGRMDWDPTEPGLFEEIDKGHYFAPNTGNTATSPA